MPNRMRYSVKVAAGIPGLPNNYDVEADEVRITEGYVIFSSGPS